MISTFTSQIILIFPLAKNLPHLGRGGIPYGGPCGKGIVINITYVKTTLNPPISPFIKGGVRGIAEY